MQAEEIDGEETITEGFLRMYQGLMDPEQREQRARLIERKKRMEERKLDTGAYVV